MELRDQVYNLGQIYARLCKAANMNSLNNPQSYERACRQPMREITIIYIQKLRGRLSKEDNEYVGIRFNDIDADNDLLFGGALPIELQGVFQLGYHHSQEEKTVKELIVRTGYNQIEIAEKLGVTPTTVSRWASGSVKISQENIYKIERLRKP
ncbi:MAG: helix-turn-helix transcriptional regulator [Ruminococcus sp.]|nr:helix-turn-helix transcriptional regulator [Ruminococcus sp.]